MHVIMKQSTDIEKNFVYTTHKPIFYSKRSEPSLKILVLAWYSLKLSVNTSLFFSSSYIGDTEYTCPLSLCRSLKFSIKLIEVDNMLNSCSEKEFSL